MKIKGAIFDADGTLLDSMPIWMCIGSRWLESKGIRPEPDLGGKLFALTMKEAGVYLKENYGIPMEVPEIVAEINDMIEEIYLNETPLKPGVLEMLDWLKSQGIGMAVATATDLELIEGALRRLGVLPYFQEIFTCSQIGAGKDKPDIYLKAAERLGTAPEDTWVFEDALHGLLTARRAGFRTVGVYDAASEEWQERLRKHADFYGEDMWQILERFQEKQRRAVLTIAGSDSSGGAGIQADLKTMLANGVYGMSAITALTAQNTTGVTGIQEVTPEFLGQQLDCVFTDIRPDAVKIGMVSSSALIEKIAEKLEQYQAENIVVDPVMVSTSGSRLISEEAVSTLKEKLLPLATVLTPNIPEAEVLCGWKIETPEQMEAAAREIGSHYHCAVLCKGGHQLNDANDLLYRDGRSRWFYGKRIDNPNTHGTGCTLSSAIASNLAKGYELEEAVERSKEYLSGALQAMLDLGRGSGPMDHGFAIEGRYGQAGKPVEEENK